MVDNLTIARELEASIKADLLRQEFDVKVHKVQEKPLTLDDVWEKYLPLSWCSSPLRFHPREPWC